MSKIESSRLRKIISGGQVGADIAALRVAKEFGLETGGWLPKGCKTLAGKRPDYLVEYGMQEMTSPSYKDRTFSNVQDSDGTLRLAFDFSSPGERCTLKAILEFQRPSFDVQFTYRPGIPGQLVYGETPLEVADWIEDNRIEVLNVAGNAGGYYEPTFENYLKRVLLTYNRRRRAA